jgi:spermidine synthase
MYADSNGVWHKAEDIVSGSFGTDEGTPGFHFQIILDLVHNSNSNLKMYKLNYEFPISIFYVLTFFSGVCGLAHEILYVKILSTYLGNIFYVTAAILITFLFSFGLGSLYARKFVHHLGYIEILIGLYSIFIIILFQNYGLDIISLFSSIDVSYKLIIFIIFLLLFFPCFLIGMTVPIFSKLLSHRSKSSLSNDFSSIYLLYNFGAALSILFLEFYLFRTFGLYATVLFISIINIVIGVLLLSQVPYLKRIKLEKTIIKFDNDYLFIFIISICSGIFQLFFIKMMNIIFGPLNENFSIVLFVTIFSMGVASYISKRFSISINSYLIFGLFVIILQFSLLSSFIYTWAYMLDSYHFLIQTSNVFKIVIIFLYGIVIFVFFGLSIPLIIKNSNIDKLSKIGGLLAVSSFANGAGFLILFFVLYEFISYKFIPFILALMILLLFIKIGGKKLSLKFLIIILILIFGSIQMVLIWPSSLLSAGYKHLDSVDDINFIEDNFIEKTSFKKFDNSAEILYFSDNSRWLSLNGYVSLRFGENSFTSLRESIVGLAPSVYSENTNSALVLGLGTGITGGTTAKIFKNTTIVEINPAILEIPNYFKRENKDVLNNQNVNIIVQDGIVTLLSSEKKYDAIINTVPSPTYYSASKLWTKEVFDLASQRLTEGGVFAGWFDLNLKEKGIKTMLKTIENSFFDCKYIYLSYGYLTFVCSNEKLIFQNRSMNFWSEEILEQFYSYDNKINISYFIENLVIFIPEENYTLIPINTFNYPFLEFSEASENLYLNKKTYLRHLIDSSFEVSMRRDLIRKKCAAYRIVTPYFNNPRCNLN